MIDQLRKARITVLQRERGLEQGLLDGTLTLSAVLEDIRPGDIVAYSSTMHTNDPVLGNRYNDRSRRNGRRRYAGRACGWCSRKAASSASIRSVATCSPSSDTRLDEGNDLAMARSRGHPRRGCRPSGTCATRGCA